MKKYDLLIIVFSFAIGICSGQEKPEDLVKGGEKQDDLIKTESSVKLHPSLINTPADVRDRWVDYFSTQKNLPRDGFNATSSIQQDVFKIEFKYQRMIEDRVMADSSEPLIYVEAVEEDASENGPFKRGLIPPRPYDSRFEISSLTMVDPNNQKIITNSFSVLGIVASSQLTRTVTGYHAQALGTLRQVYGVCPGELYVNQTVLCFGTAFLIADDIIVTAKHNLDVMPLNKMSFLIGYKTLPSGKINLDFHMTDVYTAATVIPSEKLDQLDLAIIKLDRKVIGTIPLIIEPDFDAPLKEQVYALGYPVGLPMKYITNASILSKYNNLVYYTTLDTFKGNSGSPVFRKSTHEVIGVLVEGGADFRVNGSCFVVNVCASNDCIGEKVVNLSQVRNFVLNLVKKFDP